jgi:hypothetical protein
MSDERRQKQVLDAVASGRLPAHIPKKSWGGSGSGRACSVCETPISADQLETEIDDNGQSYHLHIQCMAAWESLVSLGTGSSPNRALRRVADDGYSAAGEFHATTGNQQ